MPRKTCENENASAYAYMQARLDPMDTTELPALVMPVSLTLRETHGMACGVNFAAKCLCIKAKRASVRPGQGCRKYVRSPFGARQYVSASRSVHNTF